MLAAGADSLRLFDRSAIATMIAQSLVPLLAPRPLPPVPAAALAAALRLVLAQGEAAVERCFQPDRG